MTYNVFGGTLSLTQSINQSYGGVSESNFIIMVRWTELFMAVHTNEIK